MPDEVQACPCLDAHRRLMDVHEDIHRASENYHDQNEFRRYLNSALQNARSVTFLLQKKKSKWSTFDDWYGAWVEESKKSEVLSWSIRSRNRIVKEEDLATFSVAEVSIYGARLKEAEDVLLVPPTATAEDILRMVVSSTPGSPTAGPPRFQGTLRIFRKWIDAELPEIELIGALRSIHEGIARVIAEAHRQAGIKDCAAPAFKRECVTSKMDPRLRCIPPFVSGSNIFMDGQSGKVTEPAFAVVEYDPELAAVAVDRYGTDRGEFNHGPFDDLEPRLRTARAMLESDGFAGQFLNFYLGDKVVSIAPITFESDEPREHKVQMAVEMLNGVKFDGAMFVSEMWVRYGGTDAEIRLSTASKVRRDAFGRPETESPFAHEKDGASGKRVHYDPDPIGGRDEALIVIALSAHSPPRQMIQIFRRTATGFKFDQPETLDGWDGVPLMLKPVVNVFTEMSPTEPGAKPSVGPAIGLDTLRGRR